MLNEEKIAEILRVNHAGEYGAKVIYGGQIAALKLKKDYETIEIVKEMKAQEDIHFDYFDKKIIDEKTRPTLMQPLWRVGGFALGFLTAIIDKRAAMCCTTAVEEIIDEHYQGQIDEIEHAQEFLDASQKAKMRDLSSKIKQFQAEELEHRDIGYENKACELPYFVPLSAFVKAVTKMAIGISKKI